MAVLGIAEDVGCLNCAAMPVTTQELGRRCNLVVSPGGDGTMLRAMRLAVDSSAHAAARESSGAVF